VPGMFDQGTARVKNGKFYSRVCDDLAGAASALTMLDGLLKHRPKSTVAVLLTRAEEHGFIGSIASVLHPKLLRKSDRIISIECSAMQPYAQQGHGVILRVGDRTSIFNSALMYFMHQQAELLLKSDRKFKYQRALMPGGTCEATVFDAYGYTTGAACIPLGNYHNMDRERKKIGPEYVDLNDWKNMVKLFVRIALHAHEFDPGLGPLKKRMDKRFRSRVKLLSRS
jgi:putative aminopeptidase FrvX